MAKGNCVRPIKILFVEDNPGDVRLVKEAFNEIELYNELSVAEDGVEAIALLRREGSGFIARGQPTLQEEQAILNKPSPRTERGEMSAYVLVVDDNQDARNILSKVLLDLGIMPEVASDGEEALARIRRQTPDLVLLDLMMPCMNGFEVLFHLRGDPVTRDIPVIVVTAYHVGQQDMLRLPGVSRVIQKDGFRMTEVQSAVTEVLGGNRQQACSVWSD